jgi:hypothetical protein
MPIKNIKTDYGAAGDTQLATANVTLSLATPTQFTITSNLFVRPPTNLVPRLNAMAV